MALLCRTFIFLLGLLRHLGKLRSAALPPPAPPPELAPHVHSCFCPLRGGEHPRRCKGESFWAPVSFLSRVVNNWSQQNQRGRFLWMKTTVVSWAQLPRSGFVFGSFQSSESVDILKTCQDPQLTIKWWNFPNSADKSFTRFIRISCEEASWNA